MSSERKEDEGWAFWTRCLGGRGGGAKRLGKAAVRRRRGHKSVLRGTQAVPSHNRPQALSRLCHLLPARDSFGRAASRGYLGWDRCGRGRSPEKPRPREQKSQEEALNTGAPRPRAAVRRSWEGHRTANASPSLPHPRLATRLSLPPPDTHPNTAGKLTHPRESHRIGQTPPSPQWHTAAQVSGQDKPEGGEEGQEWGRARGPCPSPSLRHPPWQKSANWPHFGHFSQLGSFSRMP